MNPLREGFLIGVIAAASFTAGMLFLKFWRRTRDPLFLAFSASFVIEALNRIQLLFMAHPNEATSPYYFVRLISFLLILAGIFLKNCERS